MFQEDFKQERRDREKCHGVLEDTKDCAAATINKLETDLKELKRKKSASDELKTRVAQIEKDNKVAQYMKLFLTLLSHFF